METTDERFRKFYENDFFSKPPLPSVTLWPPPKPIPTELPDAHETARISAENKVKIEEEQVRRLWSLILINIEEAKENGKFSIHMNILGEHYKKLIAANYRVNLVTRDSNMVEISWKHLKP